MDTQMTYPDRIKKILTDFADMYNDSSASPLKLLFDDARKSYMLLSHEWRGNKYFHSATVHVDIIGDKIWIQNDHTEEGIATDLVEAGIPKDRIVLGFRDPRVRRHTQFAVG